MNVTGTAAKLPPALIREGSGGWIDAPAASGGLVYASDWYNNVVDIFDAKTYVQVGQIKSVGGPVGLTTDAAGNLYEADQARQAIKIYALPRVQTAKRVVADTGFNPVGVTLDSKKDIVVANICNYTPHNCAFNQTDQGNVTIFHAPGYTQSTSYYDGCFYCTDVAIDQNGNLWADGLNFNMNAVIGYWARGSSNFTQVNIDLRFPGGIQFDKAGNLVLDDQNGSSNGGSEVFVFAPGALTPSRSIIVQSDGSDVSQIALGVRNVRLYAPDIDENTVRVLNYGEGSLIKVIDPNPLGLMNGVAVFPPQ